MARLRMCGLLIALLVTTVSLAHAGEMLRYAGAITLQYFFMPDAARLFREETDVRINNEGGNTDPGLGTLFKGDIDMVGAGQHLTESVKAKGLVEHFIGWDVLCVVLNQTNPIDDLSRDQLLKMFTGETQNGKELGGPDQMVIVITRPRGFAMRTAVKKLILKDKDYLTAEVVSAIVVQADQQASPFPSAITALSKSMVDAPSVQVIKVDGVESSQESLANGRYALVKSLALVTHGEPQGNRARFIDLAKGTRSQNILKKNFVPRLT